MFVSPDTIVPDAGQVVDYNRYAYARLNPLKFNDPSGHCPGVTRENHAEASACINQANTITAHWGKTPETTAYWNGRWTSKEVFEKYIVSTPSNDLAFMKGEWQRFEQSDAYKAYHAAIPASAPLSQAQIDDPTCGGMRFCQKMDEAAEAPCQFWDCVALGLDTAILVTELGRDTAILSAPVTGPVGPTAGLTVGTTASLTLTAASVTHTLTSDESSKADVFVAGFTAGASVVPIAGTTAAAGQLMWDLADPFHPW